ncbi:putative Major facilitator superfamily transporter [Alphaproteobacteria bacterium]
MKLYKQVPKQILLIGIIGALVNFSSVIATTFTPLLLVNVFNTNLLLIGFLEGVVETIALLVKFFSGITSDIAKNKKIPYFLGILMMAISYLIMAVAPSFKFVFLARFIDRLGNGIQASPRDSMVIDLSDKKTRGICYGIKQSLSIFGSVIGIIFGIVILKYLDHAYRILFFFTFIVCLSAAITLAYSIQSKIDSSHKREKFSLSSMFKLPKTVLYMSLIGFTLSLGECSTSFLIILAKTKGMNEIYLPTIMLIKLVAASLIATPAGYIADHVGIKKTFLVAITMTTCVYFMLSINSLFFTILGIIIMGFQASISQTTILSHISRHFPPSIIGMVIGIFYLSNGIGIFVINTLIGSLWNYLSCKITFLIIAAIFSILATVVFFHTKKQVIQEGIPSSIFK